MGFGGCKIHACVWVKNYDGSSKKNKTLLKKINSRKYEVEVDTIKSFVFCQNQTSIVLFLWFKMLESLLWEH